MKNLPQVVLIAIVLAIIVAAVGVAAWVHPSHAQPATAAQDTANKPTPQLALMVKSTQPSDEQMRLGIAHKGNGVESALIRQFAANPVAYGFNGKQDDVKAIRQWAGRQAHLLAIKAGYYDWKFGAEIRAVTPNKMAFVIQKDATGNLTVVEYAVTGGSTATPTFSQGVTHISSTTIGASNFFGASPTTGNKLPVPHGEYVYFPGE